MGTNGWPGILSRKFTCEPKLCVAVLFFGGGSKFARKRRWVTLLMMMPLAYNACHCFGLMYWPLVGGSFGNGKKRLRAGRRGVIVAGAVVEGDQVAPPSV